MLSTSLIQSKWRGPKIIDETVQKSIIQEKINPVTKHVEVPLSQFTGKAMNIPVVAQRQISTETVQKTIEIPQLQCIDEVIDVPAVLVVPVPQVQVSGKTVEISQLQTAEKIVDTFDANGKPSGQRIGKEGLCDGRDEEEQTSIPSRSEQGGF